MNTTNLHSLDFIEFVSKRTQTNTSKLFHTTDLQNDLNLYGDEAVEFILAFGKQFGVSTSKFEFTKYFKPDGDSILPAIIRFFQRKPYPQYLPLTLGDLEKAIKSGELK